MEPVADTLANAGVATTEATPLPATAVVGEIAAPVVDQPVATAVSETLLRAETAPAAAGVTAEIQSIAEPKNLEEFFQQMDAEEAAAQAAGEPIVSDAEAQATVDASNTGTETPPDVIPDGGALHQDGPLGPGDAQIIGDAVKAELNGTTGKDAESSDSTPSQEQKPIIQRQQDVNRQINDLEAKGNGKTSEENAQLAKLQNDKAELDEFSALQHKKRNEGNMGKLTEDEQKRHDELDAKLNPSEASMDQSEKSTLEEQSQSIIEQIRNGEGDLLQNFVQLEDVQRKIQRQNPLSGKLREAFADALQSAIESGETDNDEAQTILEKIAQVYGMELQIAQSDKYIKKLEKKYDEVDRKVSQDEAKIKFDDSDASKKRRREMYQNLSTLTSLAVQIKETSTIQARFAQKFHTMLNQVNYSLGRKNVVSFALQGISNSVEKRAIRASTGSLRSARQNQFLGMSVGKK